MGRPVGSGTRPLAERLAEKVSIDDDTGCHVWTGALDPQGYGRIFVSGQGNGHAYVQAFLLAGGTIPAGYTLDHLCRNRRCVNPAHLEPVTRGANVLRGEGITAVNARKTHCKRGHEFTPDNTYRTGRGGRGCRTCKREYERDRQRRVRLANAPLAALAVLMATISLVGCTPEQVLQAAGHLGVQITPEQATAVAEAHTAKYGPADPTVEVTPEMAKAIAWTAAVHQAQQAEAAALPCRNGRCPSAAQWASLRRCEGGAGNPYLAVNRSGKYRGAYQMDRNFWRSYGGDPAYLNPPSWEKAPPAMQDRVAFAGYRARGSNPWPQCGRFL